MLFVHGASRGNPGPAAVGAVIKACLSEQKLSVVWRAGKSIGKRTNNEAEFEALLFGLERVVKSEYRHVVALSESEVLVKQFKEQCRNESAELKSLLQRVKEHAKKLMSFSLRHVSRSDNAEADSEATEALDKGAPSGRLQEDSSCPVCLDLFEPPVFQCPKGHLICKECLDNLLERSDNESCPECRTSYLGLRIPNVVADDLIKQWRGQQKYERHLATYKLSPKYTFDLTQGPQKHSNNVGSLNGGSYVDIIEIKRISHDNQVRGRTVSNKWLTIQKGSSQIEVFASPLPTGAYKIGSHKMPLWDGIRRNSPTAGELQPGVYIDVVETRCVTEDDRVRARTAAGKWISLLPPSTGHEWATPVLLGAYKVIHYQWTYVGAKKSSQTNGEVRLGDYVNVIETRIVSEDNRARARISTGLWMSIASTSNDSEWAQPVALGTYKVIKQVSIQLFVGKDSRVVGEHHVGDYLDIIKTTFVPKDKRVRAQISSGNWISLINSENGSEWAKPRDVAEAEEERRKEQIKDRTCSVCDRAFVHARARDQHYKDSHQLSCQGNVCQSSEENLSLLLSLIHLLW